jgi:Flp pilus assembly protein TadD
MGFLISRTHKYLRARFLFAFLAVAVGTTASVARGQSGSDCRANPAASQAVVRGWTAYRKGDISSAVAEFKRALALCPSDAGALTGAGYAAMRQNRLTDARSFFGRAIAVDSTSYDAVAGAGMAAYRAGDPSSARCRSRREILLRVRISPRFPYRLSMPDRQPVRGRHRRPSSRERAGASSRSAMPVAAGRRYGSKQ